MGILFLAALGIILANAQSDIALADMYYEEAQELYGQGYCKNASSLVERAYNLYSKHSNQPGMDNCNELDGQIDKCLRDQGYNKYQEASKKLRDDEYDQAKAFAWEAKELFSLIPDETWVSKCDELIQQVEKKIDENLQFRADALYEEALDFYQKEDYLTALEKAGQAKELYAEIPDEEEAQKADTLIENIKINMDQVKAKANLFYTYAEEWNIKAQISPTFQNFNLALDYAENASRLYSLVNDTSGYSSSQALITFLKDELAKNEERLKEEAKGRYNQAELDYLDGRRYSHEEKYELALEMFDNASEHSKYAHATYSGLYKWSKTTKDFVEREERKAYYLKKINECEQQLKRINSEIGDIDDRKKAEGLYKLAQEFKIKAKYENASEAVKEAKLIFEELGDWSDVSKCVTLIRDIDQALEVQAEADGLYEQGNASYRVANFANATVEMERAREIYGSINKEDAVELCDAFLEKITEGNASKIKANNFLADAWDFHARGTFTKSNDYAERAREIYQDINFSEGITNSKELISKNDEQLKGVKGREELQRNVIIAIIALVIILIIGRWRWDKKKKEEVVRKRLELDKRRKEALKREKDEAKLRKEEARTEELKAEREKVMKALEEEKRKNA